jgi:hypothetical protein
MRMRGNWFWVPRIMARMVPNGDDGIKRGFLTRAQFQPHKLRLLYPAFLTLAHLAF